MADFNSAAEFREVMDKVFTIMSTDPEMGPKLRDARVPQRFEFPDQDAVVNITYDDSGGEQNLRWEWSDDVDWEPQVEMTMDSDVANKYFQGKENVPMALARRRIKSGGDVKAALKLIPITKPVFAQYREMVEREYPHLAVYEPDEEPATCAGSRFDCWRPTSPQDAAAAGRSLRASGGGFEPLLQRSTARRDRLVVRELLLCHRSSPALAPQLDPPRGLAGVARASVATTVTVAVSLTPLRRARRTERSVFLESASRSRTCLPDCALRTMPRSFSDRLAPARDTLADADSVQGAAQLASTMTPRCASTRWVPAATSASEGAVPPVTGAFRLGTATNGDRCPGRGPCRGPASGPASGPGQVGSGSGSGSGVGSAYVTSSTGRSGGGRVLARGELDAVARRLPETEVQLPVPGHERLDVVLDRRSWPRWRPCRRAPWRRTRAGWTTSRPSRSSRRRRCTEPGRRPCRRPGR